MNWFKIHEDYDKIAEPYRMWIALYFMLPFFIGLAIWDIPSSRFAGTIGILFGCFTGIYRIIYVGTYESRKNRKHTKSA